MASTAPYELIVLGGPNDGATVPVSGSVTMGSGEFNSVRLDDPGVQPSHAQLDLTGDGSLWVTDLSGGRTLVDDAPVSQVELPNGSRLRVGGTEFRVHQRTSGVNVRASNVRVGPATPQPASAATVIRPSGVSAAATIDEEARPDDMTLRPGAAAVLRRREAETAERQARATVQIELEKIDATVMRSMMLPQQVIAGRYRIIDKLASGGMGEVYKAEHTELGKTFALKVMKQELSQDAEFVERFKREAVASSRIGQQNIIDISDFGRTEDGRFYFVMEYLDGKTLAELITREHALPTDRAVNIGLQIARALAAAHQQGIVHRDLKPENVVLISRDGQKDFVKVLDFGVAKEIDGRGQAGGRTAIGMVVGTPQYMSPEQAAAMPVDARSDVYSLGLIIHELLSGAPVFVGQTPSLLMVAHVTQPPRRVTSGLGLVLPEELENVVMSMLAKKPEQRPQTMLEVVTILEAQLGQPIKRMTAKTIPLRATPGAGIPRAKALPTDMLPARPSRPNTTTEPRQEPPAPIALVAVSEQSGEQSLDEPVIAPKSYAPLIAVAVVAIAALGGAGWFFTRGAHAEVPPTETIEREKPVTPVAVADPVMPAEVVEAKPPVAVLPAVQKVKVSLKSVPPKAEVYSGEELIGTTPFQFEADKGKPLKLKFKVMGYGNEERKLSPEADFDLSVELKPQKKAPLLPRKPAKGNDDLKESPF